MSDVLSSHEQFLPPPASPPDFTGLAATLNQAAQALLHLSTSAVPVEPEAAAGSFSFAPDGKPSPEAVSAPSPMAASSSAPSAVPSSDPRPRREDGETRSFYFPPAVVSQERDLLCRYRVNDFQGLLGEVHTLLHGLVTVMQSVHKDVKVRGNVISSLGIQLQQASALVLRMRNIYTQVLPLQR